MYIHMFNNIGCSGTVPKDCYYFLKTVDIECGKLNWIVGCKLLQCSDFDCCSWLVMNFNH